MSKRPHFGVAFLCIIVSKKTVMKNLLFVISVALCLSTFGQFEKGNSFLEGSANFLATSTSNSLADEDQKSSGIGLTIGLGSFISDNVAVGAGLGFSNFDSDFIQSKGIRINVFVQTFKSINNDFYFTPRYNISYGSAKNEFTDLGAERKVTDLEVSWIPGFQYALNEKWTLGAVVGRIGFRRENDQDENDSSNKIKNSTFEIAFLANYFNVGLQYFLGRK